jgi:hypothetical protein
LLWLTVASGVFASAIALIDFEATGPAHVRALCLHLFALSEEKLEAANKHAPIVHFLCLKLEAANKHAPIVHFWCLKLEAANKHAPIVHFLCLHHGTAIKRVVCLHLAPSELVSRPMIYSTA